MSAERPQSLYNKLPTEHEAVIQYHPTFLARGGDHLVYEAEGHPDTVIKASTFKMKDVLIDNAEKGLPLDGISEEMRAFLEKETEEKNIQMRLYREYFGAKHTLSERRYVMRVPISPEIIREIFVDDWEDRKPPEGISDIQGVWTTVIVQKKASEISDPNHLGLYFGGFVEERKEQPDSSEYEVLNNAFLGKNPILSEEMELFFKTQDNPQTHALADLLAKTEEDPALRVVLMDFVRKAIHFAEETGNILALAGEDNVIFAPKDGTWNYLLVDAIPLYNEPIFTLAKEAQERSENGEDLSQQDKSFTIRARNFVRTMNGLASALGIEERLEF
ncbi:MAG TPA: hypothetical protein VF829_00410 [Candidatus Paceibacterota bacterium]